MSKARHLQAIFRGQHQRLQLPHVSVGAGVSTTIAVSSANASKALRMVVAPKLESGSRSIYTQSHALSLRHPCNHSHQKHRQRGNNTHPARYQRWGHYRDHRPCLSATCHLHSSALNSSLASPSTNTSSEATAATTTTPPTTSSSSASGSSNQSSIPSSSNTEHEHGYGRADQRVSDTWRSELPWIDSHSQSAIDSEKVSVPVTNDSDTGNGQRTEKSHGSTSTSFFDQPFQNTRHNYVFAHGASGFAKNPSKPSTLTPEEESAYFSVQVGEDSYFRRHDALGVADGVGGWSGTSGANPALYSRKLMHYAFMELEKYDNIEEEAFYDYFNVNPVQILQTSYEQSASDAKKEGLIGSSTACLAILRDDELRIANLGDCGVSIIRKNEFIFRTEEQQHSFNYPYQLGTGSTDSPTDAQVFTVKVESGDIVVMGTDGIFDNLFDEDILEEVVRCVSGVDPNQSQSPFGTGNPSPKPTSKGVGGLWSELTSGAAKLASSSSSTIAAIAGKSASAGSGTPESLSTEAAADEDLLGDAEFIATHFNNLGEIGVEPPTELSPLAAAAIAAAESSALPPSASLYPTASSSYLRRSQYERKIPEPSVISEALAKRAKNVSEDTRHHGSPFQSRAMQEGLYYQGGKRDDMSVLVAIIKVAEDSPDRR